MLPTVRRLLRLVDVLREGRDLGPSNAVWLARLAQRYKADVEDLDTLIARVDEIPVSLAMAQAAEESGWGTSRFAQNGNALFGQWTTADDEGLIPKDRKEGMTHKVKAFDSLSDSVAGYMRNLNTHGAYKSLRAERATMRKQGRNLNGWALAGTLIKYSERGEKYVKSIRLIIDANDLRELDAAAHPGIHQWRAGSLTASCVNSARKTAGRTNATFHCLRAWCSLGGCGLAASRLGCGFQADFLSV